MCSFVYNRIRHVWIIQILFGLCESFQCMHLLLYTSYTFEIVKYTNKPSALNTSLQFSVFLFNDSTYKFVIFILFIIFLVYYYKHDETFY